MNTKIITLTLALLLSLGTSAARFDTDRQWYLAGEAMSLSVAADDALIAYAELCDTHGLAAGTLVSLKGGTGTAVMELPPDLHSGYYVLSVYTRHDTRVAHRLVAIVNPLHKSTDDDIEWIPVAHPDSLSRPRIRGNGNDGDSDGGNDSDGDGDSDGDLVSEKAADVRETEGHIIRARVSNVHDGHTFSASQICPSLSIVGKQIHYFEGQMADDSTAVFYTYGIHGRLPMVLSAVTSTGQSLPVEMLSPFAALVPKRLPHLAFHYNRSEVEGRSLAMQRHQRAIAPPKREAQLGHYTDNDAEDGVPLDYDDDVLGTRPDLSYNLDEYRQFLTIREVLVEYVVCVKKARIDGVQRLIVRREQDTYNATLPTLVLIDGMPVGDTERLLDYDARRIHYINIYGGQYTFGRDIYNGILSFVTHTGRLTNYPTEPGTQYLVYDFP